LLIVILITGVSMAASRSWGRGAIAATASRFTLAQWLRRAGAPVDVALGAHLAFETPKGRRSITAAQGVVGGVVALVVVGAVAMWVGGVDRIYNVPARHGWAWDAAIGNTNFDLLPATADRLAADPRIAQQTRGAFGQARLSDLSAELFAIDASGTAPPVIVSGRLPTAPNEIALGTRTLHRLAADIGATVTMSLADSEFRAGGSVGDVEMTVVGTALAPMFGESDVGDVSVVTLDAIRDAGGDPSPRLVMVRVAGTDPSAVAAQLDEDYTEDELTDVIPARVVNMHNVRRLPLLGIYLAGALGTLTLAYVIVAGTRSHRRELAVLRAIGLGARRIRRVVLWQGALIALAMVALGLPLSLLAGAGLWRRVAVNTGVQPGSVVPPAILLVIPAVLAVAVLASLFAALRVGHSRVAEVLREE
jgi:putative ABC transport system permease protein